MTSRARSNAGHVPPNAFWAWMPGRKYKRRKGRYLPGWDTRRKENRTRHNRDERHRVRAELKRFA